MRSPLRTARAALIMLVVLGTALTVMLVGLLAVALVGGLLVESVARWVTWPWGSATVGALITLLGLIGFWWALRAWHDSRTFTRLRTWSWRHLDEPFHDRRRPAGLEWVFAPHDALPSFFPTEDDARRCATAWVQARGGPLPEAGAHGRREGQVPVYFDQARPAGHQWVCAAPGAPPLAFVTEAAARQCAADWLRARAFEREQQERVLWWRRVLGVLRWWPPTRRSSRGGEPLPELDDVGPVTERVEYGVQDLQSGAEAP